MAGNDCTVASKPLGSRLHADCSTIPNSNSSGSAAGPEKLGVWGPCCTVYSSEVRCSRATSSSTPLIPFLVSRHSAAGGCFASASHPGE